jgi:hypothetical protein
MSISSKLETGPNLSWGQKQQTTLARVMVHPVHLGCQHLDTGTLWNVLPDLRSCEDSFLPLEVNDKRGVKTVFVHILRKLVTR